MNTYQQNSPLISQGVAYLPKHLTWSDWCRFIEGEISAKKISRAVIVNYHFRFSLITLVQLNPGLKQAETLRADSTWSTRGEHKCLVMAGGRSRVRCLLRFNYTFPFVTCSVSPELILVCLLDIWVQQVAVCVVG